MRELTLEEQELIAGGTTTDDTVVVVGDPGDDSDGGWDSGDWYDSGDGGWGGGGGGGGEDSPPEPPQDPYPDCVEAAPAGVNSGDVLNKAREAAAAIAAGNDENQEYSAFIYELNGVVSYTAPHTDGKYDTVNWSSADLPAGAHIVGMIHNHPDQSGIADGRPSSVDWNAYNQLQSANFNRGITMDPNALQFIYTNEDSKTRVYDKTDQNQTTPSCAI